MACASIAISSGLAALLLACGRAPATSQPLSFDHRTHVRAQVDCLACHEGLLDPEAPRLPSVEICVGCHGDEPGAHPVKQQLARVAAEGRPLSWESAFRLHDYAYFSHLRHVDVAGLACITCHADVPGRTRPAERRHGMSMDACISCHEGRPDNPAARRAVHDCAACHR